MPKIQNISEFETDDMFSFEEPVDGGYGERVLMIDWHNLMYRSVFATIFGSPEDNHDFLLTKHNLMNSFLYNIKKFEPTRVVVAIDSRSWRYDHYAKYKANRKDRSTGKVQLNTERFYKIMDDLLEGMRTLFSNIFFLRINKCEADDIIAVLCQDIYKNSEVIIVSSDSDLNQLMTNKNIKQYDPIKMTFVKPINPKQALELKILSGDTSDNIPGIRKGVGPKTAQKIISEGLDSYVSTFKGPEQTDVMERYTLNKLLIDLSMIPQDIRKSIIDTYNGYELKPITGPNVTPFFLHHKMKKHLDEWQKFSLTIKALK